MIWTELNIVDPSVKTYIISGSVNGQWPHQMERLEQKVSAGATIHQYNLLSIGKENKME